MLRGKYLFIISFSFIDIPFVTFSIISIFDANTLHGLLIFLFFNSYIFFTAFSFKASAAIPYTVSVGIITILPLSIASAVSLIL